MSGKWHEVARLRFAGDRFHGHALDLTAITELSQFQAIVAETAKALWRAANPERERLPPHFGERTRLCLREIQAGSAVTPLEVWIEDPEQPEFWEQEPREVVEAIDLAYKVFSSAEREQPLPEALPKELVPEYARLGKSLGPKEDVELRLAGKRRPARITQASREHLSRFVEGPHTTTTEVTGHVLQADVRQRRFKVWKDEDTSVSAAFTEDQEDLVTTALKEHRAVRVRVRGRADISSKGTPIRFTDVECIEILPSDGTLFDASAPAIEDEIARIWADVPDSEWKKLPTDLSDNLDHHLYGTPE